jgi:hypothetical protein
MSKSLEMVGFSIRNQLKGWISSQNEVISMDFIYRKIADVRSLLMKKWYAQNKWIDQQSFAQTCCLTIECEPIQCLDPDTGVMIDSGEKQFFCTAPFIEESLGEQAILYFGSPDLKHPYAKRSFLGQVFSKFNFYTHHAPSFTRTRNKFTIEHLPVTGAKFVTLVAIFEDVLDTCKPGDVFPFPNHQIHELELAVIQQIVNPAKQFKPSLKSDTTDKAPVTEQSVKQNIEI